MFISVLELFKIGIGPSSSHTMGPIVAANRFIERVEAYLAEGGHNDGPGEAALGVRCRLKGSLAFTGKGHATDRGVALGLHGFEPGALAALDVKAVVDEIWAKRSLAVGGGRVAFAPEADIIFDKGAPLPQHPNGMIFELTRRNGDSDGDSGEALLREVYFSIGGGFVSTEAEIDRVVAPLKVSSAESCPYPFDSAGGMLEMAADANLSIAEMKRENEKTRRTDAELDAGLDAVWAAMSRCIENGLAAEGVLPGGLKIARRAKGLHARLQAGDNGNINDWLCAYAMAVNEENAAGNMVVTAPTNGAAGVIPAVLYFFFHHEGGRLRQVRDFLLTAGAIGGIIKHRSSISGAEVGCQGEVGSAAAMAAAGLCAAKGGSPRQVENAAEIALEHHLGMTCDPVNGLVQVPCIERNGFGAIKAHTAASLALHGSGEHFMPLDNCIAAMKQTGLEMSDKYKETAKGGLAVSLTEC